MEWGSWQRDARSLPSLNFSDCPEVTDEGVGKLATRCLQLSSLNLEGCSEVTDEGVGKLAAGRLQLSLLNFGCCPED